METSALIKKIKNFFIKEESVVVVYLFGSVAKNKARGQSDIDIALLFDATLSLEERFNKRTEFAIKLEEKLGRKTDIIDLQSVDLFFIHQVMLNKVLILDKDIRHRVSFEVKQRRDFFDRQQFYDLYHAQALKRLERQLQNG